MTRFSRVVCAVVLMAGPAAAQELIGPQFVVSASAGAQNPEVAVRPDGSLLVVWSTTDDRLLGRILSAEGSPQTGEIELARGSRHAQTVGSGRDGHAVVAYTTTDGLEAQRFEPGADVPGPAVTASDAASEPALKPTVMVGPRGRFTLLWTATGSNQTWVRAFRADGTPAGRARPLAVPAQAAVAVDNNHFVAFWSIGRSAIETHVEPLYGQRFTWRGRPVGAPIQLYKNFQVAPATASVPALARLSGGFVVAWVRDDQPFVGSGDPHVALARFDRRGVLQLRRTLTRTYDYPTSVSVATDGIGVIAATYSCHGLVNTCTGTHTGIFANDLGSPSIDVVLPPSLRVPVATGPGTFVSVFVVDGTIRGQRFRLTPAAP